MNALPTVIPAQACDSRPSEALIRLMRGQYLLPQAPPPPWRQSHEISLARAVAAMAAYPSAMALSHESAALLHGATVRRPEPDVHIVQRTRPHRSSVPLPLVAYGAERTRAVPAGTVGGERQDSAAQPGRQVWLRRHTRAIDDDELTVVHGIRVTTPLVTLVDCLTDLPPRDALVVGDSLLRGMVKPDRFTTAQTRQRWDDVVARADARLHRATRRKGIRLARRLLPLLTPLSESPGESEMRFDLLAAGFPVPECQFPVRCEATTYFLDLALPDLRLGVEFDGRLKYAEQDVIYQEKVRQDRLREAGWELVRIRSEHLRYPQEVVNRVCSGTEGHVRMTPRPWLGGLGPVSW